MQTVTILGTGYVGLTTAAVFAAAGIKTFIIDKNPKRLQSVRDEKSFFYEEGIDALIAAGIKQNLLIPTESYSEAIPQSNIIFSAVGTPDNPDGSTNLTYIFAAAEEAARYLNEGAIYVQKSTVPVGTGAKIAELFAHQEFDVRYVSNPEFLREGTAVFDTLFPDRTVVGGDNVEAIEEVMALYKQIARQQEVIARLAAIELPKTLSKEQYIAMTLESAELTKVTANAFLTTKISFANSIALLADKVGADVIEVMDAVGVDTRIGRGFLNAGRGFGGGCFPKDLSGLIASGLEYGIDLEILQAVQVVNNAMPGYVLEKLHEALGSLEGRQITVLGLSFKAGTSDTRRSPGIIMANALAKSGAIVRAHDPHANEEAASELSSAVTLVDTVDEALAQADGVIIATEWPIYLEIPAETFAQSLKGRVFVDAMNRFNKKAITEAGLQYVGVGR